MEKEIREIIKSDKELKEKINAILNLPFTFAGNEIKEVKQALLALVPETQKIENKYFIREALNSIATQNEFINSPNINSNDKEKYEQNKNSSIESLANRLLEIYKTQKEKETEKKQAEKKQVERKAKEQAEKKEAERKGQEKETFPRLVGSERTYITLPPNGQTSDYIIIRGDKDDGKKDDDKIDTTASQLGSFSAELTSILNSDDSKKSVGSDITQSNTPDHLTNILAMNTLQELQQDIYNEGEKIKAEKERIKAKESALLEKQDAVNKLRTLHTTCDNEIYSILIRCYKEVGETINKYRKEEQGLLNKIAPGTTSAIPNVDQVFEDFNKGSIKK